MPALLPRILPLALFALVACGGDDPPPPPPPPTPEPPPVTPGVPIPPGQIPHAIQQLDRLAEDIMARSGIPGMAVAVVHDGQAVYQRGFGVRQVGQPEPIDANTVFQLASVSKPVGATVVARQITEDRVQWTTHVTDLLPEFALSDPWTTQHLTLGDLYAHRSGLPDHAGDDLEDVGYDRPEILERLRYLPLNSFRTSYAYTNFGITTAAQAVSVAAGTDWATLSQQSLYEPLGMTRTSSRFADYIARSNRAVPHVLIDGEYRPEYQRNPDPQSPAGGVSSSVNDMSHWLTLILAEGEWQGQPWVQRDALVAAMTPQMITDHPSTPSARSGSYGYGFNVSVQPSGRTQVSHSGGFLLGAGTVFSAIPSADIGIVVLTNAQPRGAAEAMAANFLDLVQYGEIQRDWLQAYQGAFAPMFAPLGKYAGQQPPPHPSPSASWGDYVGTYHNEYFGNLQIYTETGQLRLGVGPQGMSWPLTHWDGDTYVYTPSGENAPPGSISAVTFERHGAGPAQAVWVEFLDENGQGTFGRMN